jgi:hypothetical protein
MQMPAPLPSPRLPRVTRRLAASRFLEQARPDLLPGDDIRGILLMTCDAVIQLGALCVRQRQRLGFQAFPHRIQQFHLFGGGEAFYLISQIAHCLQPQRGFLGIAWPTTASYCRKASRQDWQTARCSSSLFCSSSVSWLRLKRRTALRTRHGVRFVTTPLLLNWTSFYHTARSPGITLPAKSSFRSLSSPRK